MNVMTYSEHLPAEELHGSHWWKVGKVAEDTQDGWETCCEGFE